MRLYTVLLTVFAIIIATVQADYCCDKTFLHDGSFICNKRTKTVCDCNDNRTKCCNCDRKCNWFVSLFNTCH